MKNIIQIYFILIFLGCAEPKDSFSLPIFTPRDLDPTWVDIELKNSKDSHKIPNFSFTNQNGTKITEKDIINKISIANYFFTTCPSICPVLTKNMKRVQHAFRGDQRVKILSFTVYPEHDTPEILSAYADLYGINSSIWQLLTGDKDEIYRMARKGHFAVTESGLESPNAFIHTENFVLVDTRLRIRGIYNGTNPHDVNRLIEDINLLKNKI